MKNPPSLHSVMCLTGNHHFLRERRLKRLLATLEGAGRSTDWVDGSEKGAVSEALGGGLFFSGPTQYVVINPQHVPAELILEHHGSKSESVLILHYEGKVRANSKFAKLIEKLPHETFESPTQWQAAEFATEFVKGEVKASGYTIDPKLAAAIVSMGGEDLGMLSFEIKKAILLAGDEAKVLEPAHFKALAPLAEVQMDPIFKALGARSEKMMAKALDKYRATSVDDPTIPICRSLGKRVLLWICAVSLADQGVPPDDAAKLMGQSPYYYRKEILPRAHRWGAEPLRRLIRVLAESDRLVLSGSLSPWDGLTCGLLRVCRSVSV